MLDEGFYGGTESGNYAAGMRGGVFSLAVCSQLPLLGRTMERLCVHRETVCLHDAGKTRPRKQQRRQRQLQQQSHVNTSKNKVELHYDSWKTYVKKILFEIRLQKCPLRHNDRRHSEEARAESIGKNSRVRICRIAFTAEASNQ